MGDVLKKAVMDFGRLAKAYDAGRLDYPPEVMEHVFALLGSAKTVLDVGCGTGIATRQLAERIPLVMGCDVDEKMIQTAQAHEDGISYFVASASKLPFEDAALDAVTAFGAFHWFCDDASVAGFQRVLKKDGCFVAVNKNEAGDFRKNYEEIVESLSGKMVSESPKEKYGPESVLLQNAFLDVSSQSFSCVDEFSIERALLQVQSMSLWHQVPEDKRGVALDFFKNYFENTAVNGMVRRDLVVSVVSGVKS